MTSQVVMPMPGYIKIKPIKESDKTNSGLYVVSDQSTSKGEVVGISPQDESMLSDLGISVSSIVLYLPVNSIELLATDGTQLIGYKQVLAVVEPDPTSDMQKKSKFLKLPEWKEFNIDYGRIWKTWDNIREFVFRVNLQKSFSPFNNDLACRFHDSFAQTIKPKLESAQYFSYEDQRLKGGEGRAELKFECSDDYWGATVAMSEEGGFLHFQKTAATMQTLVETLPTWFEAIHRFVGSPAYRRLAGAQFERVAAVTFDFKQIIKLEGKGGFDDPVKNSETMGHFIKFGTIGEEPLSPTLKPLALDAGQSLGESLGRVDLKFSYRCKIADHEYLIFVTIEAPANEDSRLLVLSWQIQDLDPGILADREYGAVFSEYFRDKILRSFYKQWLEHYKSVTLSGRGH